VRVLRGGHVESVHRFAWRLHEPDGRPAAAATPEAFLRSAAKPFQALPSVRAGVLERFGLDERHLAVACASHGGDGRASRAGRDPARLRPGRRDALGCGPLLPRDPRAAAALHGPPHRIHHNCSGKHALGLARCVMEGWPVEGYLDAEHPLQQAMRDAILEATGAEDQEVAEAVDGCGMRTYAVALEGLAAAFAHLASNRLVAGGERVARAMAANPALVAFPGAVDAELMGAAPGVVAKVGAEAVIAIGTPDGRGVALKILDGNGRAIDPAAILCARELLGLAADTPALDALAAPPILNSRGAVVGGLAASID
jgi:L-asparaginase II